MSTITFDTDLLIQKLIASGLVTEQARAIVQGIQEAQQQLITRDVLQQELAPLRIDLAVLKWGVGVILAINISLAIKAFF